MIGMRATRRRAFWRWAVCESASLSASKQPSADTAVRMACIGGVFFGRLLTRSMTPAGKSRAAARTFLQFRAGSFAVGQVVVVQQMHHLLEASPCPANCVDVVAAINQLADGFALDVAQAGICGDVAFETFSAVGGAGAAGVVKAVNKAASFFKLSAESGARRSPDSKCCLSKISR